MSSLDDFLNLPNVDDIREELTFNIGGKDLTITVRAITTEEHADWIGLSTFSRNGKSDLNLTKYMELALSNCVVEPKFNNAELLKKTKCSTGFELMSKKIPVGIMQDIFGKIQKMSGFENIQTYVEEAKN